MTSILGLGKRQLIETDQVSTKRVKYDNELVAPDAPSGEGDILVYNRDGALYTKTGIGGGEQPIGGAPGDFMADGTIPMTGNLQAGTDNAHDVGSAVSGFKTGYFDTSVVTALANATNVSTTGITATNTTEPATPAGASDMILYNRGGTFYTKTGPAGSEEVLVASDFLADGTIPLTGKLQANADNVLDVGDSGVGFRSGYFDTSVVTALADATNVKTTGITATNTTLPAAPAGTDDMILYNRGGTLYTRTGPSGGETPLGGAPGDFLADGTIPMTGGIQAGTDNAHDIGTAVSGFKTGYFDTSVVTPSVISTDVTASSVIAPGAGGLIEMKNAPHSLRLEQATGGGDVNWKVINADSTGTETTMDLGVTKTGEGSSTIKCQASDTAASRNIILNSTDGVSSTSEVIVSEQFGVNCSLQGKPFTVDTIMQDTKRAVWGRTKAPRNVLNPPFVLNYPEAVNHRFDLFPTVGIEPNFNVTRTVSGLTVADRGLYNVGCNMEATSDNNTDFSVCVLLNQTQRASPNSLDWLTGAPASIEVVCQFLGQAQNNEQTFHASSLAMLPSNAELSLWVISKDVNNKEVTILQAELTASRVSFDHPIGSEVPPAAFTYTGLEGSNLMNPTNYNFAPITSGGESPVASYTVTPTLPTGLALDTVTGVISGIPDLTVATQAYTFRRYNRSGEQSVLYNFQTTGVDLNSNLVYTPVLPATIGEGTSYAFTVDTINGFPPTNYQFQGGAPPGAIINGVTGEITGTVGALTASTVYTIRVTNPAGNYDHPWTLEIVPTVNSNLIYSPPLPAELEIGVTVDFQVASIDGSLGIINYAWSGTPPPASDGPGNLTINAGNGRIQGTPVSALQNVYTIRVTNNGGPAFYDLPWDITMVFQPFPANPEMKEETKSNNTVPNTLLTVTASTTAAGAPWQAMDDEVNSTVWHSTTEAAGAYQGIPNAEQDPQVDFLGDAWVHASNRNTPNVSGGSHGTTLYGEYLDIDILSQFRRFDRYRIYQRTPLAPNQSTPWNWSLLTSTDAGTNWTVVDEVDIQPIGTAAREGGFGNLTVNVGNYGLEGDGYGGNVINGSLGQVYERIIPGGSVDATLIRLVIRGVRAWKRNFTADPDGNHNNFVVINQFILTNGNNWPTIESGGATSDAPSNLQYPFGVPPGLVSGSVLSQQVSRIDGQAPFTYAFTNHNGSQNNPPPGVVINTDTGELTGTVGAITGSLQYNIRTTNGAGNSDFIWNVLIGSAPANLLYNAGGLLPNLNIPSVVTHGQVVNWLVLSKSGIPVVKWEFSGSSIPGLSIDAVSGAITGTVIGVSQIALVYAIRAYHNDVEYVDFNFTTAITAPNNMLSKNTSSPSGTQFVIDSTGHNPAVGTFDAYLMKDGALTGTYWQSIIPRYTVGASTQTHNTTDAIDPNGTFGFPAATNLVDEFDVQLNFNGEWIILDMGGHSPDLRWTQSRMRTEASVGRDASIPYIFRVGHSNDGVKWIVGPNTFVTALPNTWNEHITLPVLGYRYFALIIAAVDVAGDNAVIDELQIGYYTY